MQSLYLARTRTLGSTIKGPQTSKGKDVIIIMLTQLQCGEAPSTNDTFIISQINAFSGKNTSFYLLLVINSIGFLLSSLLISDLGGKCFERV